MPKVNTNTIRIGIVLFLVVAAIILFFSPFDSPTGFTTAGNPILGQVVGVPEDEEVIVDPIEPEISSFPTSSGDGSINSPTPVSLPSAPVTPSAPTPPSAPQAPSRSSSGGGGSGGSSSVVVERIAPNVLLFGPRNGAFKGTGNVALNCSAQDNEAVDTMSLFFNGVLNQSLSVGSSQGEINFVVEDLSEGDYNWSCHATDVNGNTHQTATQSFTIDFASLPSFAGFEGDTTDWEAEDDLSNVCFPVLDNPNTGTITWKGCVDARSIDFDSWVTIEENFISVTIPFNSTFNSSARLAIERLTWEQNPVIYRNGELCSEPQCTFVGYEDGMALFDVRSFSSYTTGPNTGLDAYDETDLNKPYAGFTKNIDDMVHFFANYTNVTSGLPVTGATCIANVSGDSETMNYNATKGVYQTNYTFSTTGSRPFNVSCSAAGFETLNTFDIVSITGTPTGDLPDNPNNITVVDSQRGGNLTNTVKSSTNQAGNVTQLHVNLDSITKSWAGFYGNLTGDITLDTTDDYSLYQWDDVEISGEVFASRNASPDWLTLFCSTSTEIEVEESLLGQVRSNTDSVTNTFNRTSHPTFSVGSTNFAVDSCPSLNTFVSDTYQESVFYEVLLSEGSGNMIYTTLLSENMGFNNQSWHFQMIVGEDGHSGDTATTPYYFFVELS